MPDAGRVDIDGRDVTAAAPSARGLSMVFQSYALFPHLSIAENISFGMQVRKVAPAERKQRLHDALALTNLQGLERRKPAQLSGGQRQRVALARAIVAGHSICLMDEPLSNLDAKLRHSVRHEIRSLQQRLAMTVIYVTHDQTEAMGMADRIVLMNGGRVEQSGAPASLYRQPATAFAASFIGSPPMMLMSSANVPQHMHALPPQSAPHLIGVRPEDFRCGALAPEGLTGTVTGIEFQGAESFVYLDLPGGDAVIMRSAGQLALQPGQRIGLSWRAEAAHAFDPAQGHRLPQAHRARAPIHTLSA
jgi:sn-glycerol 3-phosphate transport system ATP-binding protein